MNDAVTGKIHQIHFEPNAGPLKWSSIHKNIYHFLVCKWHFVYPKNFRQYVSYIGATYTSFFLQARTSTPQMCCRGYIYHSIRWQEYWNWLSPAHILRRNPNIHMQAYQCSLARSGRHISETCIKTFSAKNGHLYNGAKYRPENMILSFRHTWRFLTLSHVWLRRARVHGPVAHCNF